MLYEAPRRMRFHLETFDLAEWTQLTGRLLDPWRRVMLTNLNYDAQSKVLTVECLYRPCWDIIAITRDGKPLIVYEPPVAENLSKLPVFICQRINQTKHWRRAIRRNGRLVV